MEHEKWKQQSKETFNGVGERLWKSFTRGWTVWPCGDGALYRACADTIVSIHLWLLVHSFSFFFFAENLFFIWYSLYSPLFTNLDISKSLGYSFFFFLETICSFHFGRGHLQSPNIYIINFVKAIKIIMGDSKLCI